MADAQKAESTPSPDTEGVRLADELTSAIRIGVEDDVTIPFDLSVRIHAFLRTAQNTGRDEMLEALPTSTAAKDALERAIKAAGRHDAWARAKAAKDTEAVVAAIRALKSSPPVSTVADEPCPKCDDSGFVEYSSGGIWTGENVTTRQEFCDCLCGQHAAIEAASPVSTVDEEGGGQ